MQAGTIIAFPEKDLKRAHISGLGTTRMSINGRLCIAIQMKDISELCDRLGLSQRDITKVRTNYQGVYFGQFNGKDVVKVAVTTKEQSRDTLKRKYMELCGYTRKAESIRKLEEETLDLQDDIEKCQEKLVSLLRKSEEKRQRLQAVRGTDDSSLARFGDEFDQLLKHPDIDRIEITGRTLLVYTKMIHIAYHNAEYRIGKFKISIYSTGGDGVVKMINLSGTRGGCHHPHIESGGVACLGNIQEVLPHMIAEHKYAAAAAVCIQFLKSYEHSDSFRPYYEIINWPKVK